MHPPKIAILLAAYNGENWIEEQLNSIISQKNVNVSIYISIDASTDQTKNLCMRYSKVKILKDAGVFGDAAKNFFRLICDVNFADYEYIAYSDQDDIWLEHKLSRAVEQMMSTKSDGYSSNVTAFWEDRRTQLINKSQPQVKWDYLFESAGPGCTFLLNKNLALNLQKLVRQQKHEMNNIWLHDWFTYAYARANNYTWLIDSQPSMLYRQHASNQVGVNLGLKAFKHRAAYILSGKGLDQSIKIAELVGIANDVFIKSWIPLTRLGFLKLAFNANQCRRKKIDQLYFFCACIALVFFVKKY